jgi:hypothetical protein
LRRIDRLAHETGHPLNYLEHQKMKLSLPFAHLLGVKPAKSATTVSVPKATSQPTGKKSKRKASCSRKSFLDLIDEQSPMQRERAKYAKPAIALAVIPTAQHHDSPAEIAAKVIAAGEKARGGKPPYFKHDVVGDLMQRARIDKSTGIAAAILNAGAMVRGEQPII